MKSKKYARESFKLGECDACIQILPLGRQDPGFATAFLNIKFPDGRWIAFRISEGMRVPIYMPKGAKP